MGFLAFILPMAYLGQLIAVFVHEILGHGLAGILIGARMEGLMLTGNGFGTAYLIWPPNMSLGAHIFVLLAGPFATFLAGVIVILAAWYLRRFFFLSFVLVILAANLLLEGPPYLFWNSYLHLPPGDIGRVFELMPSSTLMTTLLIFGGLVTIASIVLINIALVRLSERWLGRGVILSGKQRFFTYLVLFLAQTAVWLLFDWNLLAPGLGFLPNLSGIIYTFVVLVIIWFSLPTKVPEPFVGSPGKWAAAVWLVLIVYIAILVTWFQAGIHW